MASSESPNAATNHNTAEPASEMRTQHLIENITGVLTRISTAATKVNRNPSSIRLVAISKFKPVADILALHNAREQTGHTSHFGENYHQELIEKAASLPRDINWHYTGTLQSNKCKSLASQIPNLWCVEGLDSTKHADALEKGRKALLETTPEVGPLRVFLQVNTSGEESKSGVRPEDLPELAYHVRDKCSSLKVGGLMTIGAIARSVEAHSGNGENEDFKRLRETRDKLVEAGWEGELELSMGMSGDFEEAVESGSTNVRVGTTIFGERAKKGGVWL